MYGSKLGLPNDFQSGEMQCRGNTASLKLVDIEGVNDHAAKPLRQHRREANSVAISTSGGHHQAEVIGRTTGARSPGYAADHQASRNRERFLKFRPGEA